jgi:predicted transposase/invertase (TIGR01784 family)
MDWIDKNVSPHDAFFKLSMQNVDIARGLLKWHLPASVQKSVNFKTLEQVKESFIDAQLHATSADVVYRGLDCKGRRYYYFLLEHQSSVDHDMSLRILDYTLRIQQYHKRKHPDQKLPLVYPLIFYNGAQPYNGSTDYFSLYGDQRRVAMLLVKKPIKLINLADISDDDMKDRGLVGTMHFIMKARKNTNTEEFHERLVDIIEKTEGVYEYSEHVVNYVLKTLEASGINRFIKRLQARGSSQLGEKVMTFAQELMQQGIQEGVIQTKTTIAIKLYREGVSEALIATVTGLTEENLRTLIENREPA